MVDRRELLKSLRILSGLAVLPLGNLLANDGPVEDNGVLNDLIPILIQP